MIITHRSVRLVRFAWEKEVFSRPVEIIGV
jgi:hypothetical protein